MDDSKFDFSDLPTVQAENEAVLNSAGIPVVDPIKADPVTDPLTEVDLADLGTELELQAKYGDSPISAAAMAAVDTAGFSVPGRVLDKMGLVSKEAQKEMRERNPVADTIGTVGGIIVPALATLPFGGVGAAAAGASAATGTKIGLNAARALSVPTQAGLAAERVTAKALQGIVAQAGPKKVVQSVITKGLEKASSGAVEGGLINLSQLLREDALGTADLNAENLMSAVGTGALYGGLIGGAIPVAGSSIGAVGGKLGQAAKPLFEKAISKYGDARKAAEELTGFSLGKLAKMESNAGGKALLDNLPTWYTNEVKIGVGDTAEEILQKVSLTKKAAGQAIESTLAQVDEAARLSMNGKFTSPALRQQLLHEVADNIDNEFYKPYKDMKSLGAQNKRVRNLLDDLRREANLGEPLTGKSLTELKRKIDKVAQRFYERAPGSKPVPSELAAFKARDLINKASQRFAETIDTKLGAQLAAANKNFHYATTVEPFLLKKALKDPSMIGFKDALYGLAGIGVGGGPLGAAVVISKKFLESDLRRKLLILGGIEKANLAVAGRIKDASASFLGGAKSAERVARLASLGALLNSPIAAKREEGKAAEAPKDRKEAYKNAAKNISNLIVKSDTLLDRSVKAGAAIQYAAPQTAQIVGQRAVSAIQFLQSKIPKRPYDAIFPSEHQKPYEPASMELAKFERYIQVVDNPLSVLGDLERGTLTQDHVEALRAVYPNLYSRIKQEVLSGLAQKPESEVSYGKKVQISILFNVPVDSSLMGVHIMGLQQQFAEKREAELTGSQGGQAVRSNVDPAESSARKASDSEAFQNRRNEGS